MSSSLTNLLIRIQGKIETRTRRPWFDLQRTYYYKDAQAVKNVQELRNALEHFHVLLSDAELSQLFVSFPAADGSFDFKAFAERCYPRESAQGKGVEGRATGGAFSPTATQMDASAARSLSNSQQMYEQTQQQQQHDFDQQQQYEQQMFEQQQQQQFQSSPGPAQSASLGHSGSATLGDTYNAHGTTAYYREQGGAMLTQQRSPTKGATGRAAAAASGSGGKTGAAFKPRLTYNRPAHARWNETEFVGSSGGSNAFPRAAPYPPQELSSKPRFESKPLNPPTVEVARRHNISRQYNRDGTAPAVHKR